MDKHYDFISTQKKWNKIWKDNHTFHTEPNNQKPYSIVIPPPNVTDVLHLGHALNNTIQDILIRHFRNMGYNAEWLPGTDHAGIATQVVVEKLLHKEGKTKEDIGREKFLEMVWNWANERKSKILNQLEEIGASCDWDRTKFTLDEDLSKTVAHVFKQLYDEGLIYKGTYIVNWCPRCHTALSDEEVEYKNLNGKLYYIKYPIKDSDEFIIVATTRPETMLGDTAIAINPNDENKKHLIGKTVILPLVNREIPIIADEHIDLEFGTGFVKVTPAHDPNDFEIGKRHNLEKIVIMNTKGIINKNGGKYEGLTRENARIQIMHDLEKLDLVEKIEDYSHSVGHCYRCKTVIEPYLSEQWFIKMKDLAKPALDASLNKELTFYPSRWQGVYNHWLKNIKDWCISRQLWWGHRIPIYYCNDCSHEFVSIEKPEKCPKCNSKHLRQDENVLDTWFSSWLWPFSTFGWLENSEDYKYFYPTNVIVSASEIIFFWIARMIMAGLHFTGKLPFKDVYIHGTVRDSKGIKMSKSLGNGIDPLEITNSFGADALRFSLVYVSGQGKDPNISKNTFELGRNFANKIWNAVRFVLMKNENFDINKLNIQYEDEFDKWILSRLKQVQEEYINNIENYRFSDSAKLLYEFFWHDFCDWYLEIMKIKNKKTDIALFIINNFIIMLNSLMPYITEEINEVLKNNKLIHERKIQSLDYEVFDYSEIISFKSLISSIRNLINETNINKIDIYVNNENIKKFFIKNKDIIEKLSKSNIAFIDNDNIKGIPAIYENGIVFIKSENIENIDEKIVKYKKELEQINRELIKIERNLNNKGFLNKAKPEIVQMMRDKQQLFSDKKQRVKNILHNLEK